MSRKILIVAAMSMVALPSCMHPVDQVLHARAESKMEQLADTGRVAHGACDDVGQYVAKSAGRRLTLDMTAVADISLQP